MPMIDIDGNITGHRQKKENRAANLTYRNNFKYWDR